MLTKISFEVEINEVVFGMSGDSAAGPDGFTGAFFESCWDIISEDLVMVVKTFFCGRKLPKFVTHTNLVIIPKKEFPSTFSDLRPISLSDLLC